MSKLQELTSDAQVQNVLAQARLLVTEAILAAGIGYSVFRCYDLLIKMRNVVEERHLLSQLSRMEPSE